MPGQMPAAATILLPVLLSVLSASACGDETPWPFDPMGRLEQHIVNGTPDNGHLAVGALLSGGKAACTATVVGTRTAVTAAHCVLSETKPYQALTPVNLYIGGFPNGTKYTASKVVTHPSYDGGNKSDLAVLRFGQDITGLIPQVISTTPPVQGESIVLVGYGLPGENTGSFGVKRMGTNVIDSVSTTTYYISGSSGHNGNVCNGDSGGPSFASRSGKDVFIGVHSTKTAYCGYAATDMRVDAFRAWITQEAGGDIYTGKPPDKEAPQVAILDPIPGAEIVQTYTVKVLASDDIGVTKVVCYLDAASKGELKAPPYSFTLSGMSLGQHTIEVVGHDEAGRSASAAITVTVKTTVTPPPQKQPFGGTCTKHDDCQSGICMSTSGSSFCSKMCEKLEDCTSGYTCKNQICQKSSSTQPPLGDYGAACQQNNQCKGSFCALDNATQQRFCTMICDPGHDVCPDGAVCTRAGATAVCAPGLKPGEGGEEGCTVGPPTSPSLASLTFILILLVLRRRARPGR